jgi:predicted enzyme related to lactoylglutathione lyase
MSDRVVHFEVPFDDGDRARSFYKEIFGWQITEMPEMDYTMVMSGPSGDTGPTEPGYINGGMASKQTIPASGPVLTIGVDDIDATLSKIEQSGGARLGEKVPVGDMGFAAYFRDTEGNVLGLWQNAPQA